MNLLIHPWRILAVLGAAVCFYMALFLYKDERDHLQNYLEDWWVKLHDKQKEAMSKHTAFMQIVAEMSSRAFDRVFGKKYFSTRAIVVSICISTVSFQLGLMGTAKQFDKDVSLKDFFLQPATVEYGGICFFFAILLYLSLRFPALAEKKAWLAFVFATAIAPVAQFLAEARFGTFHYQPTFILLLVMAAFGVLLLSFGVDLLFIAGTRWAVSWASGSDDFFRILTVICLNILAAVCLVYWPLMWSFKGVQDEFMRCPICGAAIGEPPKEEQLRLGLLR
jgi:hypothetical protein